MLHKIHRVSALILGVFIVFHLINHLFILSSVQQHIDVMNLFRGVYRNIIVECVLLLCAMFQVSSGIYFVWNRRGQRKGFLEKAQAISGLYLAYFLLNHIGAVLFGRGVVGIDTNIYFGISGLHIRPFYVYFFPYYFLAVVALFVHLASAFNWLSRNKLSKIHRANLTFLIIAIGVSTSFIMILGFSGFFSDILIPPEYSEIYAISD